VAVPVPAMPVESMEEKPWPQTEAGAGAGALGSSTFSLQV
jgi:hypothetical protein